MLANELDAALAMIDTRNWRAAAVKQQLLAVVKINTLANPHAGDYLPLGVRYFVDATGLGIARVSVILAQLVDEGVLRVALEAAGQRGRSFVIQPELRTWKVPWRRPIEVVEAQVDLIAGRLVYTHPGLARAARGRAQPLLARAARARAQDPACVPPLGVNTTSTPAFTPRGRAQPLAARATAPLNYIEDQSLEETEGLQQTRAAIAARTHSPVLGTFGQRLARALDGVDHQPILRAIDDAPPQLRMPGLVGLVEQLAAGQRHELAPSAPPAPWVVDAQCPRCEGSGVEEVEPGRARPCGCARRSADPPA